MSAACTAAACGVNPSRPNTTSDTTELSATEVALGPSEATMPYAYAASAVTITMPGSVDSARSPRNAASAMPAAVSTIAATRVR